jgi:hypothetical protein
MDLASNQANLEADFRFPSGPWTGFFLQPPHVKRHWMDLALTFKECTIRGSGHDWVCEFLITGRYELDSGKCWWTKRYLGKHDVSYQGYAEEKGIWGMWQIPPALRGGFHIWPKAAGGPGDDKLQEAIEMPQLAGAAVR